MTKSETVSRRIDVPAIGLFALAVGALTVGMAQVRQIPEVDKAGVLVIARYLAVSCGCSPRLPTFDVKNSFQRQPSRYMASSGHSEMARSYGETYIPMNQSRGLNPALSHVTSP